MAHQRKVDLVKKYKAQMQSHPVLGMLIIGGGVIIGVASVLAGAILIYDFVAPSPKPELEVLFIDKQGPETELSIEPSWTDVDAAGLSKPVPIIIGLRNRGDAPATNVKVHLVYPPAIISFEKGSGESVTPAVLSGVLAISGDETAQSFSIGRVDTSNIFVEFEKSLHLRLRLREKLGVPFYKNQTLVIVHLFIDFISQKAGKLGKFPIECTISYSESNEDKTGTIYLKIDESQVEEIRASLIRSDAKMQLVGRGYDENFDEIIDSTIRSISFVNGDQILAMNIILDLVESTPDKFIETVITENTSERDRWQMISAEGEFTVVLIDRGKDGSLDAMYINKGDGQESDWMHWEPDLRFPFVTLANIIDPKTDASMVRILKSSFGLSD